MILVKHREVRDIETSSPARAQAKFQSDLPIKFKC